jgi:four helix bundle protein
MLENLDVLKRFTCLRPEIYKHLVGLKNFRFRDQITRSSLPISSSIAEGMKHSTAKEKVRFLDIANGSAAELRPKSRLG